MYARILKFENADPAGREEGERTIRARAIPMLEQQDGFTGYIGIANPDERRFTAIVLWESKENAEAAEAELAPRRKEMIEAQGLTISENKVLEAPIVEMRSGVTA